MMEVKVTDKGAIYVDDSRVTHRGTKWGIHYNLDVFEVDKKNAVYGACVSRGFKTHADNIDIEGYGKIVKIYPVIAKTPRRDRIEKTRTALKGGE